MSTFGECSLGQLSLLRVELKERASGAGSLREAGGVVVHRLLEVFGDSLVLVRLFGTIPFRFLPESEQSFARRVAVARGLSGRLDGETMTVTLLATAGRRSEWNDPSSSRARLAIPLLDESSLESVPLIQRLLGEANLGLPWLRKQETLAQLETTGGMSRLLHVADAGTVRTSEGGMVIPDQDFVAANAVRTVLALGGSYLNGSVVVLILFTNELLTEEQSVKFTPLLNTVKAATMKLVMAGRIF